eukprot:scaffold2943_cov94-Isochrysis_galbana.AAC.1
MSTMGLITSDPPGRIRVPASHARASAGSMGTRPKNGTSNAAAMASAPPRAEGKTSRAAVRVRSSGQRSPATEGRGWGERIMGR